MQVKNIAIYNMYPAILGIRNSFKSKDKSDSIQSKYYSSQIATEPILWESFNHCEIGEEDEKLIKKLLKTSAERKFLRQILVSMDIKGSIKFWAQMDTFKIGTVRNSESTMHCLTKGEVTQDDFERNILPEMLNKLNELIRKYNKLPNEAGDIKVLFELIDANLPSGYLLESHWTANYEVLRNIYNTRKNHKMFYWSQFCEYIEKLPYFNLLIKE